MSDKETIYKFEEELGRLVNTFQQLANYKTNVIMLGGTVIFNIVENDLVMITDAGIISFPFKVLDDTVQNKFKENNPQHIYKNN